MPHEPGHIQTAEEELAAEEREFNEWLAARNGIRPADTPTLPRHKLPPIGSSAEAAIALEGLERPIEDPQPIVYRGVARTGPEAEGVWRKDPRGREAFARPPYKDPYVKKAGRVDPWADLGPRPKFVPSPVPSAPTRELPSIGSLAELRQGIEGGDKPMALQRLPGEGDVGAAAVLGAPLEFAHQIGELGAGGVRLGVGETQRLLGNEDEVSRLFRHFRSQGYGIAASLQKAHEAVDMPWGVKGLMEEAFDPTAWVGLGLAGKGAQLGMGLLKGGRAVGTGIGRGAGRTTEQVAKIMGDRTGAGVAGRRAVIDEPTVPYMQRQAAAERLTGQLPVETAATVPAPPTGVAPAAEAVEAVGEVRFASTMSSGGTVEAGLSPGSARSVYANEINPKRVKAFNEAFGTNYTARNIADAPSLQALRQSGAQHYHASPVCKNFTKAKRISTADPNDLAIARSVARDIREVKPPTVSIENVPRYRDTALFKLITKELDDAGYNWDVSIVNAADYGGAQTRERMILRAVRKDIGELPALPQKTHAFSETGIGADWYTALKDLIDAEVAVPIRQAFARAPDEIARIRKMFAKKEGDPLRLVPNEPIITMGGSASRGVPSARNAGNVAPTLLATEKAVPRIIIPGPKGFADATVIRVTPAMMRRLMGLPDSYVIPGDPGLAKNILGDGVHGSVTKNFIQPLVDIHQGRRAVTGAAPSPTGGMPGRIGAEAAEGVADVPVAAARVAEEVGEDVAGVTGRRAVIDEPTVPYTQRKQAAERVIERERTVALVDRVSESLRGASRLSDEADAMVSRDRSKRVAIGRRRAEGGDVLTKSARFFGAQAGRMSRPDIAPIRQLFTHDEYEELVGMIYKSNSPLRKDFQQHRASEAFKALFSTEAGVLPNRSDLSLLSQVYGDEFVKAVLSKRRLGQKAWDNFMDAYNLPRSLLATMDLSATLRQGAALAPGNKRRFAQAFNAQVKAFLSQKSADDVAEYISEHPDFERFTVRAGEKGERLFIADMSKASGFGAREEAFMSHWASKIPLVKNSERAYITMLNKLRFDVMDDMVRAVERKGVQATDEQLDAIATYVNWATGRGPLGMAEKFAPILNGLFFSPRLATSRFAYPLAVARSAPGVRRKMASDLVSFVGTGLVILQLADWAGAEVETDPRSSDFGKIKIGKTRYDIWGGFQQVAVLMARLLTGERKSLATKGISEIDERPLTARVETLASFLRNKLHPVSSEAVDQFVGTDFLGNDAELDRGSFTELTRDNAIYQNFVGLFIQDVVDVMAEEGYAAGIKAAPSVLGVGVSTFSTVDDVAREELGVPITELWPYQQTDMKNIFKADGDRDPSRQDELNTQEYEQLLEVAKEKGPDKGDRYKVNQYFIIMPEHAVRRDENGRAVFGDAEFRGVSGGTPEQQAALQEYFEALENSKSPAGRFLRDEWNAALEILERKWTREGTIQYVWANTHTKPIPGPILDALKFLAPNTWDRIEASKAARNLQSGTLLSTRQTQ